MSDQPTEAPEPRHIEVEPYGDDERATPPEWYEGDTQ